MLCFTELKKDEVIADGSKQEKETLLEELSAVKQSLEETQSQAEQLSTERKQLQEKLKSALKNAKVSLSSFMALSINQPLTSYLKLDVMQHVGEECLGYLTGCGNSKQ